MQRRVLGFYTPHSSLSGFPSLDTASQTLSLPFHLTLTTAFLRGRPLAHLNRNHGGCRSKTQSLGPVEPEPLGSWSQTPTLITHFRLDLPNQSRVNRTRPRCPAFQWPATKATRAWAGGPLSRPSLCVPRGRLRSTARASLCPGKLEDRRLPPVLVPLVLSGPASPRPTPNLPAIPPATVQAQDGRHSFTS